jgi:hypothetical protein
MAISLEELALGALEGGAGPWTLAMGAGALAVALAAGSARPVRRMASTGAFVAQRTGQLSLTGWISSARQGWLDLVAEARAEYEAGRQTDTADAAPIALQAVDRATPVATVDAPPAAISTNVAVISTEPANEAEPPTGKRDQRGRFVRRSAASNGSRSE